MPCSNPQKTAIFDSANDGQTRNRDVSGAVPRGELIGPPFRFVLCLFVQFSGLQHAVRLRVLHSLSAVAPGITWRDNLVASIVLLRGEKGEHLHGRARASIRSKHAAHLQARDSHGGRTGTDGAIRARQVAVLVAPADR